MSRRPINLRTRFEVYKRDNFTCRYCGQKAPDVEIVPDHVMPVVLGGLSTPENLVTACFDCNSGKSGIPLDTVPVADIAKDAERWRNAISMVADEIRAHRDDLAATLAVWVDAWNAWGTTTSDGTRVTVPLPIDYAEVVAGMVTTGGQLDELLDIIPRAMQQARTGDRFGYFTRRGWKHVRDIQGRARARVTPASDVALRDEIRPGYADGYLDGRDDGYDVGFLDGAEFGRSASSPTREAGEPVPLSLILDTAKEHV